MLPNSQSCRNLEEKYFFFRVKNRDPGYILDPDLRCRKILELFPDLDPGCGSETLLVVHSTYLFFLVRLADGNVDDSADWGNMPLHSLQNTSGWSEI